MSSGRPRLTAARQYDGFDNRDEVRHDALELPRRAGASSGSSSTRGQDSLPQSTPQDYVTGMRDLAVEVLIQIFTNVVPTSRRHIRLTHVCCLWRALILDIPEFWADMLAVPRFFTEKVSEQAVEFWHAFINRTTSTLPLKLQLNERSFELLKTIPQHLPRISYLSVRSKTTSDKEPRPVGFLNPLPSLETLICTGDGYLRSHSSPYYPRLRHLEVSAISFSTMRRMAGPSLTTLIIHTGALRPSIFLAALSHCSALEVLRMWRITTVGRPTATAGCVRLKRLRKWTMSSHSRSDEWIQYMLCHIACPPTAKVTIRTTYDYASNLLRGTGLNQVPLPHFITDRRAQFVFTLAFDAALDAPVLQLQAYLLREKSPRFRLSTTDVAWRVGSRHLGLRGSPGPSASATATVASSVIHTFLKSPLQGLTTLQLRLSRRVGLLTHAQWKVFLEAFSGLRSLSVRVHSCKGLLRALRRYAILRTLEKLDITCSNGTGTYRNLAMTVEVCVNDGLPLRYLAFYHRERYPRVPDTLLERMCCVVPEVVVGTF